MSWAAPTVTSAPPARIVHSLGGKRFDCDAPIRRPARDTPGRPRETGSPDHRSRCADSLETRRSHAHVHQFPPPSLVQRLTALCGSPPHRGCTRRWSPRTAGCGRPGTSSTVSVAGNSPSPTPNGWWGHGTGCLPPGPASSHRGLLRGRGETSGAQCFRQPVRPRTARRAPDTEVRRALSRVDAQLPGPPTMTAASSAPHLDVVHREQFDRCLRCLQPPHRRDGPRDSCPAAQQPDARANNDGWVHSPRCRGGWLVQGEAETGTVPTASYRARVALAIASFGISPSGMRGSLFGGARRPDA